MQSFKPLARQLRSILILLALCASASACVQAPPVLQVAGKCSEFVPEEWANKGVVSADLPPADTVGEWMAFGDAQTGRLDNANAQTRDTMAIIRKCEARYQAAADAMKPKPWWRLW